VSAVLLDTGPLVAYCSAQDANHEWARTQIAALRPPLVTCEAVLVEAFHLLGHHGDGADLIWQFMRRGIIRIAFDLESDFESVATLMSRYGDQPMDLADACLVRMSELSRDCRVLTTDGDFKFYRRFGRQIIPLLAPF